MKSSFLRFLLCALLAASAWVALNVSAATPMAAGGRHSLALKSDGAVVAFGSDSSGELGSGRLTSSAVPMKIPFVAGIKSVAAGTSHVLALARDGQVWGWGDNSYGKLGSNASQPLTPAIIPGMTDVTAISAGQDYSLALKRDGTVWAWGANWAGTLGDGTEIHRATPAPVPDLTDVVAISANGLHNLALKRDGSVWAWGYVYTCGGDVCQTDEIVRRRPVQIAGLQQIVGIKAGFDYSVVLKQDGTVWTWGRNWDGGLGDGTTIDRNQPVQLSGLPAISRIFGQMAIAQDGSAWAWGTASDAASVLGKYLPIRLTPLDGSVELAPDVSLALRADGKVLSWTYWGINAAAPVAGLPPVVGLASGRSSFVVTSTGEVWGWGSNAHGELGVSTTVNESIATPVANLGDAVLVSAGQGYSLAVKRDGTLWIWGNLQISGNATGTSASTSAAPLRVPGLSGVVAASTGDFHNLLLLQDGTVWAWGSNYSGGLGIADSQGTRTVPAQVPGLADIVSIHAGQALNLAVSGDGYLWIWGRPVSSGPILTPTKIEGFGQAASAANSGGSIVAVLADGSVWEWLPDGTLKQISSLADVKKVFAGYGRRFALKSDGTLWAWGRNYELAIQASAGHMVLGLLGNGSTSVSDFTVPVRVDIPAPVVSVAPGLFHVLAQRSDGSVWGWGLNVDGQLGDGTYSDRLLATLVANETIDGPLDLIPEVANTIPADKIPPFFLATAKSGELSATNLSATIKGGTAANLFAAGYNIYVAAMTAGQLSSWWQLDASRSWSTLTWPMAAFMSGVALDSQSTLIRADILQNADLSQLGGSVIYLGYGTDTDEMLRAGRYRDIFTVPPK